MMGTHHTTLDLLGVEVEVEVDFDILTYPTSPSGYGFDGSFDPGEVGEIEIKSVRSCLTGDDLTALCAGMHTGKLVETYETRVVPLGHWRSLWNVIWLIYGGTGRIDYVTRLRYTSTALEDIEAEIHADPDHFDRSDDGDDYDPRDWA